MSFYVMRDKRYVSGPFATDFEAAADLHRQQGQSVHYATTYGGWAIEEINDLDLIGKRVRVHGGFEDGATGVIIGNEPDRTRDNPYGTDRPLRFRIEWDGGGTTGGFHPVDLEVIA